MTGREMERLKKQSRKKDKGGNGKKSSFFPPISIIHTSLLLFLIFIQINRTIWFENVQIIMQDLLYSYLLGPPDK